ncbi:hypothetical protein H6F74_29005 [Trichocoleus sp. FACHB-90]|nr:hypothetical protein [Trichocoleus sp. FACHB-90]MBD1930227.1 hypothetical protein [Trichocoleus sp. FACHB-90]
MIRVLVAIAKWRKARSLSVTFCGYDYLPESYLCEVFFLINGISCLATT